MRTRDFDELVITIGDRVFFRFSDTTYPENHPEKYAPALVLYVYPFGTEAAIDLYIFGRHHNGFRRSVPHHAYERSGAEAWVEALPED